MATDAKLFIGNADGSMWTDMIKLVSRPAITELKDQVYEYSRSNTGMLASIQPIANSKWLVPVE